MRAKTLKKNEYDVIVIGAGIAGLVCGCYLAKAGMKVLIIEKNSNPGGYCTSFEKEGFEFDAGVHGIGGLHEAGRTSRMIRDLSLPIEFNTRQPSETIYFKNKYAVNFWKDAKRTEDELKHYFPNERKKIEEFIHFILKEPPMILFSKCRNKTFSQILDCFFKNADLKSIFRIPGGNIGLSSNYASALSMLTLYREFLFNPSRYPKDNMQSFPNVLKEKFTHFYGDSLFKTKAVKIQKGHFRYAVFAENGEKFFSKKIVFNIDPMQLYRIGSGINSIKKFYNDIRFLTVSPSAFFVNIGLSEKKKFFVNNVQVYNLWYFPKDDTIRGFFDISHKFFASHYISSHRGVFISFPSEQTVRILIIAPYQNDTYWQQNKGKVFNNILKRAEGFLGSIIKFSKVISLSTPIDLHKVTLNYRGACYGWTPIKTLHKYYPGFATLDENLFLCGHWVSNIFGGSGIASVVNSGMVCSDFIIRNS